MITAIHYFDCFGRINRIEFYGYVLDIHTHITGCSIVKAACEIFYDNVYQVFEKMKITDVGTDEELRNNGYASLVLSQIIRFAQVLKISKIVGKLSARDIKNEDDFKKLSHFYGKFGFSVAEDWNISLNILPKQ